MRELPAPEIVRVGLNVLSWGLSDGCLLFGKQLHLELLDDCVCDLVLDRENVSQVTVKALSPEMVSGVASYELSRDAHARSCLADTSFQDELDTKFPCRVLHRERLALGGEHSVPVDDMKTRDL